MLSARRSVLVAVGTLAGFGLIAVVLGGKWGSLMTAISEVPYWIIAVVALLQVVSLAARTEGWYRCVSAAGSTVPRRRVFRIASLGYLGNIVNGELGFGVRIAALRRAAPDATPKLPTIAMAELPIVLVEAALGALVSFTLIAPLELPWWTPIACFVFVGALGLGLHTLAKRRGGHRWSHGLTILKLPGVRWRMAGFVTISMVAQVGRNWVLLHAVGLDPSPFDAAAVLVAVAVIGALPVGPSAGTGAFLVILGADGVAAVGAAGLLLTATGALGAFAYAAWALADQLYERRHLRPERARVRRAEAASGAMHAAVGRLAPAHRRLVETTYFGGLTHHQVARMLFPRPAPRVAAG